MRVMTRQRRARARDRRTVRRPRCGGCGRWVTRGHNGQPLEHVAWNGSAWIYTCHPIPPHERPEPMDVPLPFPVQAGEPTVAMCQVCQRQEVVVPSGEFDVLCGSCRDSAEPRTRPQPATWSGV